jgi:ribosomal protein L37AE/L43A
MTASSGERVVPYYCPYCGDEDLRPSEAGHGTWECRACARAFSVRFIGLVVNGQRSEALS